MTRQFVACTFTDGGRPYTYHFDHDGEALVVGERVTVETQHGEKTVTVAQIITDAPPYATKPVKGRAPSDADNSEAA